MSLNWDRYSFQARILPNVLLLLPAWLAIPAWVSSEDTTGAWALSATAWLALGALGSQLGRDEGKRKEKALFALWGGSPTTILLRHRSPGLPPHLRTRYHEALAKICGHELPSAAVEAANPVEADQVYESCVRVLREKTRDRKKFRLVFAENVTYGFRRNLWGMKPAGILLGVLGALACGYRVYSGSVNGVTPSGPATVGFIASATALVLWTFRVTPSWIRLAADAYAERLLGATESLR